MSSSHATGGNGAAPSYVRVYLDEEGGGPAEFRFADTFQIGRGNQCAVQVRSGLVSRVHAEVTREGGRWWVRDLGSTNGVFLDGKKTTRALLPAEAELQLGPNAPTVRLRIEQGVASQLSPSEFSRIDEEPSSETMHSPEAPSGSSASPPAGPAQPDPSVSQVIRRYFDEDDQRPAGEHTRMIRSAYAQVKQKQTRRYRGIIIGVVVLFMGALAFAIYQRVQNQRLANQAARLFEQLKRQDLQIAQFRQALEVSENQSLEGLLAEAEVQRERMAAAYDGLIEEFGLYRRLDDEERLIYRMARVFNESQFTIPAGFVREVKRTIRDYWLNPRSGKGRFEQAVQRAEENGYTALIVDTMQEYGLPPEFFYLSLQESDFKAHIVGPPTRWGRAKGMWQFIPSTAERYGLDVGERTDTAYPDPQDERLDVARATDAAARYLLYIYSTPAQASGLLVMASYNWGEHRVIKKLQGLQNSEEAIDRVFEGIAEDPDQRNYWHFLNAYEERMPEQTKDYVLKIFSAAVIGQDPRHFGFDFDDPLAPYLELPAETE